MKSVGYCRVSGDGQIAGGGFPRQEEAIQKHCASHSVELIRFYREEGVAGKLGEESRPAFQEMVADLLGNGCRTVVVESLDRLARQYDIQQQLATYLASKGIALFSANTGEDITAALMGDPMRRAMVQIQGIFAELDKNMLVAKLRKGREHRRALGLRAEGRKPYGDTPSETEVLTLIRRLRIDGAKLREIVDYLNERSIMARSGKVWTVGSLARILAR